MDAKNPEMLDIVTVIVPVLFGIVGLAVLAWLVVVTTDLMRSNPRMQQLLGTVLNPAPAKLDVDKSALPVKVVIEGLVPLIFWLLIFLPMIIFPIILVVFPLFHIPWSYLLPPVP